MPPSIGATSDAAWVCASSERASVAPAAPPRHVYPQARRISSIAPCPRVGRGPLRETPPVALARVDRHASRPAAARPVATHGLHAEGVPAGAEPRGVEDDGERGLRQVVLRRVRRVADEGDGGLDPVELDEHALHSLRRARPAAHGDRIPERIARVVPGLADPQRRHARLDVASELLVTRQPFDAPAHRRGGAAGVARAYGDVVAAGEPPPGGNRRLEPGPPAPVRGVEDLVDVGAPAAGLGGERAPPDHLDRHRFEPDRRQGPPREPKIAADRGCRPPRKRGALAPHHRLTGADPRVDVVPLQRVGVLIRPGHSSRGRYPWLRWPPPTHRVSF